ncbi:MAG TPA: prolyl oligopeptidase family serine peptidase [Thermoanaerobaculia bacterium]|nr:prolyl oligopeptidase family serine peptidase [Thermoanaerobaculia bacterium]
MTKRWVCLAVLLLVLTGVAAAQGTYQVPSKELVEIADAPPTPTPVIGPGDWVVMARPAVMFTIADLSQPELRLGGYRFNPNTREQTRSTYAVEAFLLNTATGEKRSFSGFPSPLRLRNPSWAPDGNRVAFTLGTDAGVTLWVAEVATGRAARVGNLVLNNTHPRRPYEWMSDSRSLVVRTVPSKRTAPPEAKGVPAGPLVQENLGRRTPSRTLQDLLQNEHDAAVFEHHLQSQLVAVTLDGKVRDLGAAGLIVRHDPSPDGTYILVETVKKPFSYIVAESRFPRRLDVWTRDGKPVRTVADLPLMDTVIPDRDAAAEGPRGVSWRADAPATLYWVEAQDKGNPRNEAAIRDRVLMLAPPFTAAPTEIAALATRYGGITWGNDDLALVTERWWKTRRLKTWRIHPAQPGTPDVIFDRSSEDRYNAPGSPVTRRNARGQNVLALMNNGTSFLLFGDGASPEGDRPFIDRFDLAEKKATRLWRSEGEQYEVPVALLDNDGRKVLTRRETPADAPNYSLRDLSAKTASAITSFPHPMPQMAGVKKELLRYDRADGVKLTATLYTPAGYDPAKDGRLPVLIWAYPEEFLTEDAAGQVTTSPYRFIRASLAGALPFLMRGYAVLDDPSIPIIGRSGAQPNDTYVEQLISGATAAVEEVVKRGVGDRDRMAVAGHSYGAFMTANLLAHTDLFRAGIARSGAYNRTLTPFTFQAEERTFWEASDTYIKMSPFVNAQKINEPLLLIHGAADDNPGSFPIQSERLFQALKGLGGTARLVMLPHEAHGYRARESVLHMLWEQDRWLETYVKNAKPR